MLHKHICSTSGSLEIIWCIYATQTYMQHIRVTGDHMVHICYTNIYAAHQGHWRSYGAYMLHKHICSTSGSLEIIWCIYATQIYVQHIRVTGDHMVHICYT